VFFGKRLSVILLLTMGQINLKNKTNQRTYARTKIFKALPLFHQKSALYTVTLPDTGTTQNLFFTKKRPNSKGIGQIKMTSKLNS